MTLMSDPYQHLITALRLSQDHTKHTDGERVLQSLRQHSHYPLLLAGGCADESLLQGDRQMAFILLKQLVREHWDSDTIPLEFKADIRKLVLDQITKLVNIKPLLTQCCLLIAAIAEYDLQTHEWPDLIPVLLRLTSMPMLAPASIYCISLLVSDLPLEHLVEISEHLYPVLTEIFGNVCNPALLRYRSICIFTSLVDSIACVDEEQESLKDMLGQYVPVWFEMLESLFSRPADSINNLKFAMHIEACDLIATLSRSVAYKYREPLLQRLPDIALCVLNFALPLLPLFQKKYIDAEPDSNGDDDSNESVEGVERSSLSHLFTSVVDLFSVLAWPVSESSSQFLANHLDSVAQLMVTTLQVPSGEHPMFENDVDYLTSYTARSASKDLASRLQNLLVFGKWSNHSSLEQFSKACLSMNSNWKAVEAGMFLLGQLSPIPDDTIPMVIDSAVSSNTFIRTRALWVLKQILTSGEFSNSVFSGTINAIVAGLSEECEAVRLTAVDCISVISNEQLISIGDTLAYVLQQVCQSVRISTSQDNISTYLDTIQKLLSIPQLRQAHLHVVCSALMETWSKNVHDAVVTSRLVDTFAVCCVSDTIQPLQLSVIPIVIETLKQCDISAYEGLFDLLSRLVSPCEDKVLADELCDLVVPLIVQIVSSTDELALVSSGISCLTNVVRNANEKFGNLLVLIMPAVYSLLQQKAMVVPIGNLIYAIIHVHHGRFQEQDVRVLVQLLQERILASGSSFATVGDSVLALSKLIHAFHAANILHLMIEANGHAPERLGGLFKKWVDLYEDVHSPYLKNISFLALSEIARLHHPEIDRIIVPGYTVVDTNAPRCTRSQGPATAVIHKEISLPAKIISLLVCELSSSNAPSEVSSDSQRSETGRGALDEFASDFLEEFEDDNNGSSEQILFASDAIANMDLCTFVPNFIREFHKKSEAANWCFAQLALHDQSIVQKCLNSIL